MSTIASSADPPGTGSVVCPVARDSGDPKNPNTPPMPPAVIDSVSDDKTPTKLRRPPRTTRRASVSLSSRPGSALAHRDALADETRPTAPIAPYPSIYAPQPRVGRTSSRTSISAAPSRHNSLSPIQQFSAQPAQPPSPIQSHRSPSVQFLGVGTSGTGLDNNLPYAQSTRPSLAPDALGCPPVPINWDDPSEDGADYGNGNDDVDMIGTQNPQSVEEAGAYAYLISRAPAFATRLSAIDNGADPNDFNDIPNARARSEPVLDSEKSIPFRLTPTDPVHVPVLPTNTDDPAVNANNSSINAVSKPLSAALNSLADNTAIALNRSKYDIAHNEILVNLLIELGDRVEHLATKMDVLQDEVRRERRTRETYGPTPPTHPASSGQEELRKMSANISAIQRQTSTLTSQVSSLARSSQNAGLAAGRPDAAGHPPAPPRVPPPVPPKPAPLPPRPIPPPPPQQPTSSPDYFEGPDDLYAEPLREGHQWFLEQIRMLSPETRLEWAKILTWGKWGPINANGNPTGCGGSRTPPEVVTKFLISCVSRAFDPITGCGHLPVPPLYQIPNKAESLRLYDWICYTGLGRIPTRKAGSAVTVVEPPVAFRPAPVRPNPRQRAAPLPLPLTPRFDDLDTFGPGISGPGPSQDDVYYEDLHPEETWNVATRKGKAPASYANAAAAPSSSRPAPPNRPSRRTDTVKEKWVLKFPQSQKIPPSTRPHPEEITRKINAACTAYSITALYAQWTEAGNLIVGFTSASKQTSIQNASQTIINLLSLGRLGMTFTKTSPWSKVSFPKVPCQDPDSLARDGFLSSSLIPDLVRDSHPALANVDFVQQPDWAMHPDKRNKDVQTCTISFGVNDPDGSILATLSKSVAHMRGTQIFPTAWKEKISLTQCDRCFAFGPQHPACTPRCDFCASSSHTTADHNTNCKQCLDSGLPIEQIQDEDWFCLHARCRNCGGDHPSSSTACPGRNKAIHEARRRKSGMVGQTLLDPRRLGPQQPRAARR